MKYQKKTVISKEGEEIVWRHPGGKLRRLEYWKGQDGDYEDRKESVLCCEKEEGSNIIGWIRKNY